MMKLPGIVPALWLVAALASPPLAADAPDLEAELRAAIDEAQATEACDSENGTIEACGNAVLDGITRVAQIAPTIDRGSDPNTMEAEERVEDKATSAETGTGGTSPMRDTLSRFITAAGIPGLSDEDGELVFAFNAPPGLLDEEIKLSLKATAKEPVVYQPLLDAFDEDAQAARKTAFEDRLGDFDDVEAELRLSRLSERFGREFAFHRDLFQSLWAQAADLRFSAVREAAEFLAAWNLDCPGIPEDDQPRTPFGVLARECPNDDVEGLRRSLVDYAAATATAFVRLVKIAEERGVMEVADLVNNQPQAFLDVKYRERDAELTGPDELSIQLKWEKGFRNVNGLREFCAERNQLEADPHGVQQPTLDCVHEYLYCKRSDPTDCSPAVNQARKARRFSLSAEYTDIDPYSFSPEEGVDVDRDASEATKVMAAYGWQIRTDADGTGGNRIDFDASYEDVSDDPSKNDRLVGTLTYSQQLAGETAASISLVWADKPEYRGEVDEELSARLGLKWTLDPKKK